MLDEGIVCPNCSTPSAVPETVTDELGFLSAPAVWTCPACDWRYRVKLDSGMFDRELADETIFGIEVVGPAADYSP